MIETVFIEKKIEAFKLVGMQWRIPLTLRAHPIHPTPLKAQEKKYLL